ncbi:hypothetical protein Hanom_Chr16g01487221 [Helianthus anomalus]
MKLVGMLGPAQPFETTRRPDRPAAGPTAGLMLKRTDVVNRPGTDSGSRPDRSDQPGSGLKTLDITLAHTSQ